MPLAVDNDDGDLALWLGVTSFGLCTQILLGPPWAFDGFEIYALFLTVAFALHQLQRAPG
jgi:hypothetical protein